MKQEKFKWIKKIQISIKNNSDQLLKLKTIIS